MPVGNASCNVNINFLRYESAHKILQQYHKDAISRQTSSIAFNILLKHLRDNQNQILVLFKVGASNLSQYSFLPSRIQSSFNLEEYPSKHKFKDFIIKIPRICSFINSTYPKLLQSKKYSFSDEQLWMTKFKSVKFFP